VYFYIHNLICFAVDKVFIKESYYYYYYYNEIKLEQEAKLIKQRLHQMTGRETDLRTYTTVREMAWKYTLTSIQTSCEKYYPT